MSSAPRATLEGMRILTVEDEFVVLLELATVLRNAGAAVRTCATVKEALSSTQTEQFDVAVLDVRVGRDSIDAVAQKLSELGTPFVFYTGQVTSDGALARWPEVRVISKPARPSAIVTAVMSAIRRPPAR